MRNFVTTLIAVLALTALPAAAPAAGAKKRYTPPKNIELCVQQARPHYVVIKDGRKCGRGWRSLKAKGPAAIPGGSATQGVNGADGARGADGVDGLDGTNGLQGPQGEQ